MKSKKKKEQPNRDIWNVQNELITVPQKEVSKLDKLYSQAIQADYVKDIHERRHYVLTSQCLQFRQDWHNCF